MVSSFFMYTVDCINVYTYNVYIPYIRWLYIMKTKFQKIRKWAAALGYSLEDAGTNYIIITINSDMYYEIEGRGSVQGNPAGFYVTRNGRYKSFEASQADVIEEMELKIRRYEAW